MDRDKDRTEFQASYEKGKELQEKQVVHLVTFFGREIKKLLETPNLEFGKANCITLTERVSETVMQSVEDYFRDVCATLPFYVRFSNQWQFDVTFTIVYQPLKKPDYDSEDAEDD